MIFRLALRFLRRHLRVRIGALFLLCGVLPILLTGFVAIGKFESDLVRRVIDTHRQLIREVTREIRGEVVRHESQLGRLARRVSVQSMRPGRMQLDLDAFLVFHPLFRRVEIFSTDGKAVASSQRGAVLDGSKQPSQLPAWLQRPFQEALQQGKAFITPPVYEGQEQVRLCFVAPVPSFVDERPPVGVAVATLEMRGAEIQRLVEDASAVAGTTWLCVTDPGGLVVARLGSHFPGHLHRLTVTDPDGAVPARTDGEPEIVTGLGELAGERDLLAVAELPLVKLKIVVGRPYSEVRQAIVSLLDAIAAYVTIGVVLALLLGVTFTRELVGPILSLAQGINRVARGEVAHRITVDREDELGQAAQAFNEMASELEKGRLLEGLWQARRGAARTGPPR